MELKPLPKNADGTYDRYAWPGGYPVYYLTRFIVLCPDCASKDTDQEDPVIEQSINWENDSLICEECGNRIEAAYVE